MTDIFCIAASAIRQAATGYGYGQCMMDLILEEEQPIKANFGGDRLLINDIYNIIQVLRCPKCGQYPDNMVLDALHDDHFICTCDNCNSKIKVTYNVEIL